MLKWVVPTHQILKINAGSHSAISSYNNKEWAYLSVQVATHAIKNSYETCIQFASNVHVTCKPSTLCVTLQL